MKTLQKVVFAIGLIGLLYSCQSTNTVLSKSDKRMEIMNAIANDQSMSKEMMGMLMKNKMEKMDMKDMGKMKEKHAMMMKMMEEHPEMMKDMMNEAKKDTTMMSGMCKAMMGNEKMMKMMKKMKEDKMDMKKMEDKK